MNFTNKVMISLISVCLTLPSGRGGGGRRGEAGCRYGALHCSSHKSLNLHQPGLGALYTWCTAAIPTSSSSCWLLLPLFSCFIFRNVFFPSLHPHFHEQYLPVAFWRLIVWSLINLKMFLIYYFFLIGGLPGYWTLCWKLFFFKILKVLIHLQCCFSEIWRLLTF